MGGKHNILFHALHIFRREKNEILIGLYIQIPLPALPEEVERELNRHIHTYTHQKKKRKEK